MASRFFLSNESAERYTNEYYDILMKENQQKEQILYKPLYEHLLSQYNKYKTQIPLQSSQHKVTK